MAVMKTETSTLPRARLGVALRMGFRETWDRLGLVLAMSMTWTVLLFVPLGILRWLPMSVGGPARFGILLAVSALALSAPTAGLFALAQRIFARDEVTYLDVWRGARQMFGPATRLGLIQAALTGLFVANLAFYARLGGLFGIVAALVCLYLLLFWGMLSLLLFPLLAAQETGVFDEEGNRARRGALAVYRRAFYLALGDPFYLLGLLLVTLILTALLLVTGVLFAGLWAGTVALLTTAATRGLLIKYEILPAPPVEEPVPDEKFRLKG